jgi:hypothetical protein
MLERTEETDVLVIGGGTAGAIAAIQAARAGASTTLVEMSGQLGGTTTSGGINYPSYFWCQTHQVIGGIGWELVVKTSDLDGTPLPDFNKPNPRRPSYPVWVNAYLYAALAEEEAVRAGVQIRFHELPVGAAWDESARRHRVEFVGKNQRRTVLARELIDCTGGADVVGMLGFERVRGEGGKDVRQPGTLAFRLMGYDPKALEPHKDTIQTMAARAFAESRLRKGDWWRDSGPFIKLLWNRGLNQMHVLDADDTTSDGQTDANLRGRASMLRILRFVRTLPGCENARIEYARPDTAIRETYRIVGETTITKEDYVSGRVFDDAVGYTFYFIDLHTEEGGIAEHLPPGVVPTLPLSAMVPAGSRHLLAAGRCVSSDRLANSALRVQSSCMAMGQGAGAAAALASRLGVASKDVPIDPLRALLTEHGAILPPRCVSQRTPVATAVVS